jgi:hypothetical protein
MLCCNVGRCLWQLEYEHLTYTVASEVDVNANKVQTIATAFAGLFKSKKVRSSAGTAVFPRPLRAGV